MAGMNHHDLIDTTEMYLRTVLELEEEGIIPLRARIAEHLGQAAPTVSQTIARMERDDLITLDDDRRIRLTPQGRLLAERVMRKHRLAECFLADVLGLEWQLIHDEACRWEHVMSEAAERRLLDLLGHPTHSPYGNPIPALDELGAKDEDAAAEKLVALASLPASTTSVVIRRIGESLQPDTALLTLLDGAGLRPNARVPVSWAGQHVTIGGDGNSIDLDHSAAAHLFVTRP
jgi:DtxR family Mn-dependent transcriptional regulator